MVFQICFDVYESTTQHFVDSVSYPDYPFHFEIKGFGLHWTFLGLSPEASSSTVLYHFVCNLTTIVLI